MSTNDKAILLLSQAPEIEELRKEIRSVQDDAMKRVDELKDMAKHIETAMHSRLDGLWNKVAEAAQTMGVLPEGFVLNKTHSLGFSYDALILRSSSSDCQKGCKCLKCTVEKIMEGF